jgi:hypothetical protein
LGNSIDRFFAFSSSYLLLPGISFFHQWKFGIKISCLYDNINSKKMSQPGNTLGTLLLGTLIGGAIGMYLYATKSRTIKKGISNQAQNLADQLTDRIEEGKSVLTSLQKKTNAAKNKITHAMEEDTDHMPRQRQRRNR